VYAEASRCHSGRRDRAQQPSGRSNASTLRRDGAHSCLLSARDGDTFCGYLSDEVAATSGSPIGRLHRDQRGQKGKLDSSRRHDPPYYATTRGSVLSGQRDDSAGDRRGALDLGANRTNALRCFADEARRVALPTYPPGI
jgi:hypothetical protein